MLAVALRIIAPVTAILLLVTAALSMQHRAYAADLSPALRSKVQRIARDIASTQQRIDTDGQVIIQDAMKTRQLAQRIQSFGNALAKMPSDDDPVLLQAKAAHVALVERYNTLIGSGSNSNASAQSKTAQTEPKQQHSTPPQNASGAQLVSGQRVQVRKLTRDIQNLISGLTTTGPSALQDGRNVEKYRTALEKYASQLKRYSDYSGDPDVISAAQAYQQTQQTLSAEFQRAREQIAILGDVQAILSGLRQSLRDSVVPGQLFVPITDEEAQLLINSRNSTKVNAQKVLDELARIKPLAYLEINNPGTVEHGAPYDQSDVRSMGESARSHIQKSDQAYSQTLQQLQLQMDSQKQGQLGYFESLFANPEAKKSTFISEGAEQRNYAEIDRMLEVPQSLAALERAEGKPVSLAVRARTEKLNQMRDLFAQNRLLLLGESSLPDPVSTDAQRIAYAKQILANPAYEFGTHGPVVLTTENIETRSKEVNRDTIKDVDINLSGTITWSGTRETWNYEWDEFKFATPLKHDNGEWYIWWITAKFFRSGSSATPLNKWVSGRATQGDLILPENF